MRNIKFEVKCPGCEKSFYIQTRKPSIAGSVRSRSQCPHCESSILYRVDRVIGRTVKGIGLRINAIKFKPSALFLEALAMADKERSNNEINSSIPSDESSNDITATGDSSSGAV